MTTKLLLAGAAFAVLAFPAMAQAPAVAPPAGATSATSALPPAATPPVNPDPTAGATSSSVGASAQADTGTAANTSATEADLKTGATVTDSTGAEIGKISKVTKKADGKAQVTLSANGKTISVPASSLSVSGGALVSSASKADIWGPK
ncbi:hypothetical protein [Phenylobacterium sp.]|uniref:hypothetical protein n=1 Tax=Phenylobacterium sp. TaxID=1871053 RepID=UPI002FCC612D